MTLRFDLGFLGGGQLARMSIQAATKLGLKCLSLDPGTETPSSRVAPALVGSLGDPQRIAEVFGVCERVTLENEFVPAEAIRQAIAAKGFPPERLIPSVDSLATIQDRLAQKLALFAAGVPAPRAVALEGDAARAVGEIGFPMVLKTRFGGYDGKGTRYAMDGSQLESLRPEWSQGNWLAEEFVNFEREVAAIVYLRGAERGAFPTMETVQIGHVCDHVFPSVADASDVAIAAARAMGSDGLFGVEMFETRDGEFLVNEIAPRPHNSGHYSLDWGGVSQFEQHVRLVAGLPLLSPSGRAVCMANLLGQEGAGDYREGVRAAEQDSGVRVHWYEKSESRPGRKMGHLNAFEEPIVRRALDARIRFYEAWTGSRNGQ
jgi:5-(carboxyamino)imidazole ribonucleotide synthase